MQGNEHDEAGERDIAGAGSQDSVISLVITVIVEVDTFMSVEDNTGTNVKAS